jgi:phospho-N-acetylmuramoyl-pentapeptide-transferase
VITVAVGLLGLLAVYAAEITDGLDGLMVGIFGIILSSLALLLVAQGQYLFVPFIAVLVGVIIVDLYFNIPPARFWNGGPGAMPLGFATFMIALISNNLIPYLVMSSITWLIMASSTVQILSMKFLNRRVFKIAPIHHHFQAVGWPNYKVTMRFWLFTAVSCLLGIFLGIVL